MVFDLWPLTLTPFTFQYLKPLTAITKGTVVNFDAILSQFDIVLHLSCRLITKFEKKNPASH